MTDATSLADRSLEAIADDRRVPVALLDGTTEADYHRTRSALSAFTWQLAAMPAHQLDTVAAYLSPMLAREPLRSSALLEPHRVVLGLLSMALSQMVTELDPDFTARPVAWFDDAVDFITVTEEAQAIDDTPPDEQDDDLALL